MAALVENLTLVGNPFPWTVFFAHQPDPDLEFTEEELDQTTATRATGPLPPHKKSGGNRPILWILLLLLIGIAYLAVMKPEMWVAWLGSYLGEHTSQPTVHHAAEIGATRGGTGAIDSAKPEQRSLRPRGPNARSRRTCGHASPDSRPLPSLSKTSCASRNSCCSPVQRRAESDRHRKSECARRKHSVVRRCRRHQARTTRSRKSRHDRPGRRHPAKRLDVLGTHRRGNQRLGIGEPSSSETLSLRHWLSQTGSH